jgi:hypothetical protein
MSEPKTGYEHVPTRELPKIRETLIAVVPEDAQHKAELDQDLDALNAEIGRRLTKLRTNAQMESIVDEWVGPEHAYRWNDLLATLEPKPELPFFLTDHVATDECLALVFSNGLVVRLWHPEDGPEAFNGNMWNVEPLGWE